MRLSDIKGEKVLDILADIVEPVANIAGDPDVKSLFKGASADKIAELAKKAVPALLKTHREDVVAILALLDGVSNEEYEQNMTMAGVLGDAYAILTDEELLSFLSAQEQTEG